MASKRQEQVAEIIKRNFGIILQQEGSYIYGDAFVTVTQVQVTPDLSEAKLYISVFNSDDKQAVLQMMVNGTKKLKHSLAHRIKRHVRRIPDISIFLDDTLDEMYKLNEIFNKLD
jgi:ribosome-binding factor A